ncbi:MAG TPA: alpha/beta fold hydrolase [Candidatus Limnocylindrales bacterium]|nr:alpha/beta fold hydrolase [Candidatus Limnocylindrales bacterium]
MRSIRNFLFLVLGLGASASWSLAAADELPRRPMLGASLAADSAGARVNFVLPGSPAEKCGLKTDDIVTSFAAHATKTPVEVVEAVRWSPLDQPLAVQILRAGAAKTLTVRLTPAPTESDPDVQTIYGSIRVGDTLRRTLTTVPRGSNRRFPAVLIIGGIGCYTVDNPNDSADVYRLLAHDLGRAGIVVMRLEKSGIGDSQGGPCFNTDFNSESLSYKIALQALCGDSHVDPEHVFLFGHSIGTVIGPQLAIETPVAGIIAADGVARNWFEYELLNLRRQAELGGDSPSVVDATLRLKEVCMHRLLIERQSKAEIERAMPECSSHDSYPVAAPYLQQVAAVNMAELWTRVSVPVLALYGTGDFVTSEEDHRRIAAIVNANHPGTAVLHTIDGMDHYLTTAGTPQAAFNLRVVDHKEAPYDKRFSSEISTWICAKAACG